MDIRAFKGLNNVTDPLRVGAEWLSVADNVNITDTGSLIRREGYSRVRTGDFTGSYTTLDYQRMYLVDGGSLKTFDGTILKTGLSSATMYWTEINDQVFYNNGVDSGIIKQDNSLMDWAWPTPPSPAFVANNASLDTVKGTWFFKYTYRMPDGRMTGEGPTIELTTARWTIDYPYDGLPPGYIAMPWTLHPGRTMFQSGFPSGDPVNLMEDLTTEFLNSLPSGCTVVQAWRGRIYAAQYFPEQGHTAVWFSEPMAFHLFSLNDSMFMVPGQVHMLAPHKNALIVGTDQRIYAYDEDKLDQLAPYGVVPGQHWSIDDERIVFWSKRGLCEAIPFSNLTERQVSVAPGVSAGGTIVRSGGQKRYVVALRQGGAAFNSYV